MSGIETAILKTLVYRDLFDFPLTEKEIYCYLISRQPFSEGKVRTALEKLVAAGRVGSRGGDYFVPQRDRLVALRRRREGWSQLKFNRAKRAVNYLRRIPWVEMIGVTGAVAPGNAVEADDIDLLVVSSPRRLWLTRLLVVLLLKLGGSYYSEADPANRFCPNIFLEVDNLAWPTSERNLHSAHDAVLMRVVWDRNRIYRRFLQANPWVKKFLANSLTEVAAFPEDSKSIASSSNFGSGILNKLTDWLEVWAFKIQLWYMRRRRTREVAAPTRIHFKKHDHKERILKEYQVRLTALV